MTHAKVNIWIRDAVSGEVVRKLLSDTFEVKPGRRLEIWVNDCELWLDDCIECEEEAED